MSWFCLTAAACGEVVDASADLQRLNAAIVEQTRARGDRPMATLAAPFARPRLMVEIDTDGGHHGFDAADEACKSPGMRLDIAQRRWFHGGTGQAFAQFQAENNKAWTSTCRKHERMGRLWAAQAAEPNVRLVHGAGAALPHFSETLVSPVLTYSEVSTHLQKIAELADGRLRASVPGETRLRIFAGAMSPEMVLQFIRLHLAHQDAVQRVFHVAPAEHQDGADASQLAAARNFAVFLVAADPASLADIAAAAAAALQHRVGPEDIRLAGLADATPSMVLASLPASLDAASLTLYVDTCYALLKMAHLAGELTAEDEQALHTATTASVDDFLAAVARIDADLAKRLRNQAEAQSQPAPPQIPAFGLTQMQDRAERRAAMRRSQAQPEEAPAKTLAEKPSPSEDTNSQATGGSLDTALVALDVEELACRKAHVAQREAELRRDKAELRVLELRAAKKANKP